MTYRYDGPDTRKKFPWRPGETAYASAYRIALDGRTKISVPPCKGLLAAGPGPETHAARMKHAVGATYFVPFGPDGNPDWSRAAPTQLFDFADDEDGSVRLFNERVAQYIGMLRDEIVKCVRDTIPQDENIRTAELTSEWDDHETTVDAPCKVDMKTRRIFDIDLENRTVTSADDDIGPDNVDDAVDSLDGQTVTVGGKNYPAVHVSEWDPSDPDQYWYE